MNSLTPRNAPLFVGIFALVLVSTVVEGHVNPECRRKRRRVFHRSYVFGRQRDRVTENYPKYDAEAITALRGALSELDEQLQRVRSLSDYQCQLLYRERINGEPTDSRWLSLKVKRRPYRAHGYVISPPGSKGNEFLYHGRDSTESLRFDIKNVLERVIRDLKKLNGAVSELSVKRRKGKYSNTGVFYQPMSVLTIRYAFTATPGMRIIRVFSSDKQRFPFRVSFIRETDDGEEVMAEYTYINLKANVGMAESDFNFR